MQRGFPHGEQKQERGQKMKCFVDLYLLVKQLPINKKEELGIKIDPIKPRYDVVKCDDIEGMRNFRSTRGKCKGGVNMQLDSSRHMQERGAESDGSDICLKVKGGNFTGLHIVYTDKHGTMWAWGNPCRERKCKFNGKLSENPMYEYRDCAYVFRISKDWLAMEIFVVRDAYPIRENVAFEFAEGICDEQMNEARARAKAVSPFTDCELLFIN